VSLSWNKEIYTPQDSWLHAWEPRFKLLGLGALILAFAMVRQWQLLPFILLLTAGLYRTSQLPLNFLTRRLRYPGLILLGLVGLLPFISGQTVIWQWGLLTLRQEGCLAVGLIAGRFFSITTLGLLLLATTPFVVLVRSLRSLGLPVLIADMTLLSYRYLFDIGDNFNTMRTAMRLRGFQHHTKRWITPSWLNQLASLAGSLLIRSYEQSERVYQAMRLRGYSPHTRPPKTQSATLSSWHGFALGSVLLIAVGVIAADFVVSRV